MPLQRERHIHPCVQLVLLHSVIPIKFDTLLTPPDTARIGLHVVRETLGVDPLSE